MTTLEEFCNQRGIPIPADPDEEKVLRALMTIFIYVESILAFYKKTFKLTLKLALYVFVIIMMYLVLHMVDPLVNALHRYLFCFHLWFLNVVVHFLATWSEIFRQKQIISTGKQYLRRKYIQHLYYFRPSVSTV